MRVLIDENAPVQLLDVLAHLLPDHEVAHIAGLKWSGKKDLAVLADAASRGFEVFLTKDSRQLR
jgi:predicted nuclease of predicted toxin-antitoxin system